MGPFLLDEAHELDHLVLLPLAEGVRHLQRTVVGDDVAAAVRHGQVLEAGQLGLEAPLQPDAGPWGVLTTAEPCWRCTSGETTTGRSRRSCSPPMLARLPIVQILTDSDPCPAPPEGTVVRSVPTTACTWVTER